MNKVTFVVVTIGVEEAAFTVEFAVLELTFVFGVVGPFHYTVAVSDLTDPLASIFAA